MTGKRSTHLKTQLTRREVQKIEKSNLRHCSINKDEDKKTSSSAFFPSTWTRTPDSFTNKHVNKLQTHVHQRKETEGKTQAKIDAHTYRKAPAFNLIRKLPSKNNKHSVQNPFSCFLRPKKPPVTTKTNTITTTRAAAAPPLPQVILSRPKEANKARQDKRKIKRLKRKRN